MRIFILSWEEFFIKKLVLIFIVSVALTGCLPPEYAIYEYSLASFSPMQFVIPEMEGSKESDFIRNNHDDDLRKCKNFYQIGYGKSDNDQSGWAYMKLIPEKDGTRLIFALSTRFRDDKKNLDADIMKLILDKLSIQNPRVKALDPNITPAREFHFKNHKEAEQYLNGLCNQ